jgi:hypothetical protein
VVTKPLLVRWVHGEEGEDVWHSKTRGVSSLLLTHHVLLLVCASGDAKWVTEQREGDGEGARCGWTYIRGAADDHQSWGLGLTAELFWRNVEELTEDTIALSEVEERVRRIVSSDITAGTVVHGPRHFAIPVANGGVIHCFIGGMTGEALAREHTRRFGMTGACCMLIEEKRLPTPTPIVEQRDYDIAQVLHVTIDSRSTKFGVQRALPILLAHLNAMPSSEGAVMRVTLGTRRDEELHLIACVAVALRVETMDDPSRLSKRALRCHEAVVGEVLGPSALLRSEMIQLNRYFLSSTREDCIATGN